MLSPFESLSDTVSAKCVLDFLHSLIYGFGKKVLSSGVLIIFEGFLNLSSIDWLFYLGELRNFLLNQKTEESLLKIFTFGTDKMLLYDYFSGTAGGLEFWFYLSLAGGINWAFSFDEPYLSLVRINWLFSCKESYWACCNLFTSFYWTRYNWILF